MKVLTRRSVFLREEIDLSVSDIFDIPDFYYFDSGNDYSGSRGEFAYKIKTEKEKITCMTWHGKKCSMKADIENTCEFTRSNEGFDEMIKWLEDRYKEGQ